MGVDYFMVEIQHEEMSIEDLFITCKDTKTKIIITLPDKGDFSAYITPVTYGQVKKLDKMSEEEITEYVLTNHFFKPNGDNLTASELELLPAGVLKGVAETIMDLSGLNTTNDNIRVF
jgi:hypothetical protein